MKKRLAIIGILLAVVLVFWWRLRQSSDQGIEPPENLPEPVAASTDPAPVERRAGQSPATAPPPTNSAEATAWQARVEQAKQQQRDDTMEQWRTPIDFYGKVMDETNNPVAGAQVDFICNDLSSEGHSGYKTTSDALGLFELRGASGKFMSVRVTKEGYYTPRENPHGFDYAGESVNFRPDANNPVVFRLRKKGAGEPLLTWAQKGPRPAVSFAIPRDGTPTGISFQAGKRVNPSEADLLVRCWTDDQGKRRGQKYDWRCQLAVPGGGLQETKEEFPFLAPESGYQATVEINMPASLETGWLDDVTRQYYVKLANGTYGRLTFGMVAGGDHYCLVEPYINPSGSRNLEAQ